MDANLLAEPQHEHKHEGGGRSRRHLPVLLIVALLVLSSCATFAVIMTNGPDYRAAAEPAPIPTLTGLQSTTLSGVGGGLDKSLEPLSFAAAVPEGPIRIGEPGTFVITVDNPHSHPVRLETVGIEVLEPTVPGCRAEWLRVDDYEPGPSPLTIPAEGSVRVRLPFTLVDLPTVNQDACQGADFPLSITGSGVPVP